MRRRPASLAGLRDRRLPLAAVIPRAAPVECAVGATGTGRATEVGIFLFSEHQSNRRVETVTVTASPVTSSAASAVGTVRRAARGLFGDDGFGFKDILDLVNPLQHIPVIGNLYRKLTGDTLAPAIRVAGGALFGGPLGAGLSLVGLAVEEGAKKSVAAAEEATAVAAPSALAAAPRSEVPRGGWMLAAAATGRLAGLVPDGTVAANAAVAAAEAATAPVALVDAPGVQAESKASATTRELRLPARRPIVPRALPPPTTPLADGVSRKPRVDAQALAAFAAWQSAIERGTTRLVDYA